jgi:hypothetical protein
LEEVQTQKKLYTLPLPMQLLRGGALRRLKIILVPMFTARVVAMLSIKSWLIYWASSSARWRSLQSPILLVLQVLTAAILVQVLILPQSQSLLVQRQMYRRHHRQMCHQLHQRLLLGTQAVGFQQAASSEFPMVPSHFIRLVGNGSRQVVRNILSVMLSAVGTSIKQLSQVVR